MGRLTKRHGKHAVQIGAETRRNDVGWLKLAHYEDLEEQGRLMEQKYGQWSLHIDETFDCEYLTCSICGEDFFDGDNDTVDYVPNYCPRCGARMLLEAKLKELGEE